LPEALGTIFVSTCSAPFNADSRRSVNPLLGKSSIYTLFRHRGFGNASFSCRSNAKAHHQHHWPDLPLILCVLRSSKHLIRGSVSTRVLFYHIPPPETTDFRPKSGNEGLGSAASPAQEDGPRKVAQVAFRGPERVNSQSAEAAGCYGHGISQSAGTPSYV